MRNSQHAGVAPGQARPGSAVPALAFGVMVLCGCSGHRAGCARIDPALLACPAPRRPHVAHLGGGRVVVKLAVLPGGQVAEPRVIAASGPPAWKHAVLQAVRRWRYKPQPHEETRVIPFRFMPDARAPAAGSAGRP